MLRPWIFAIDRLRQIKACDQSGAHLKICNLLLDPFKADFTHPFIDAIQIFCVLAVGLRDRLDDIHNLVLCRHLAEQFGFAHIHTSRATDTDLKATIDADNTDIFARGFSAISWATRDTKFQFMRRPRSPKRLFKLDPKASAVLRAKAAMICANTGFHRAQTFGIGVTRHHSSLVQIVPDRR